MSLSEFLVIFRAQWRLLAGSLVFALAGAAAYLSSTTSQYEASATVRLGELGRVGAELRGRLVESDAEALARVGGAEFKGLVINALGWKDNARVGLLKASYQVTSPENHHLRFTVRGQSPEDAAQAVTAAVDAITRIHSELAESILARRSRELKTIESDIADAQVFLRRLEGVAQHPSRLDSGWGFANWLNAIKQEKSRLRSLELQRLTFVELNSAEFNLPTRVSEPVLVSRQPVQPRANRVWFFSAFAGLLIGTFLVTAVAIRRMKLGATSSSADR